MRNNHTTDTIKSKLSSLCSGDGVKIFVSSIIEISVEVVVFEATGIYVYVHVHV